MAGKDSIGGTKGKAKKNTCSRLTDHEIALIAELVEKYGYREAARRFEVLG